MKNLLFLIIFLLFLGANGYCRDTQTEFGEFDGIFEKNESVGKELIAGFSLPGLLGGILFGSTGFVAFVYGKKSSKFKTMIFGILLMVYPYFTRGTVILYLVGSALILSLYLFRD